MTPTNSHQPAPSARPLSAVPLLDVGRQYDALAEELNAALVRVCQSGRFVLGPDCQQLEQALAQYCRVKHAIACASGSDALLLALMAAEVGPGDEVLVPSYTFFATASAVARLGALPVFVDIEPASYNLDPARLARLIGPKTKAIVPVHLYGQCVDMDAVLDVARRHDLAVIEDAAQAIGAEYIGRRAGGIGDLGCLSFYPTKNLGAFGDGGLVTTNRDDLAEKLRLLRVHGMQPRYHHQVMGINSRLDTLQAAVLNVKLPHLDRWTARRQEHAAHYNRLFTETGLSGVVGLPRAEPHRRHVWNQYVIRVGHGRRDALREHLTTRQVGTEIYYPIPLHLQPCFAYLGGRPGSLHQTERAASETLALPMYAELTLGEQETVVREIADFFGPRHGIEGPKFLRSGTTARSPRESKA